MVVDELDALREKFDSCETLAFSDLSTQMILVTDSTSNLRREALDRLCAEAALLLGARGTASLGAHPSTCATIANPHAVRIFLRTSEEPNDALCCVCAPTVDVDAFLNEAKACLNRILSSD